ncbi:DUF2194 domain-containing protein [Flavobacterium sp. CYK-4]|uniref:DUF2194 domain-containing protein n=1 Tax=Flavobacterium lotistagni TaxID=2709660 RepID=UPI00140876D0|nr:DUF2194 domain-containing protein [Flavobacterium lotistagni]NHM06872.1 DUF2194 domain-containing protein [Flavobacterium lotistagni]
MKMSITRKYLTYSLAIACSVFMLSCEGLDDWSDLKSIELFNGKGDAAKGKGGFKRYEEPIMSTNAVIESVYDPASRFSKSYNSHIRKVCDYTKIPFHAMPITQWNSTLRINPATRVIVVYDTKKLNDASVDVLLNFVTNGGTLFIPFANEDHRMAYLLGFKAEAEYATDTKAMGWHFNTPFLPGLKGKSFAKKTLLYGFAAQNFSSKVKVLATAANNPSAPTITENPIGKGKVILFNTSGDFSKVDRGFLFAGILKGLEGIPYPVANTSTIFLDDFPAPQYDIIAEPIKTEMNMTTSDYVQKVWWPDMRDLGKEYKIPYAAMLTFDYRNKIVPPFTLDQWNSKKIKTKEKVESLPDWLVNDVKRNGHELAFHGYNHVSLLKHLWKNPKFIETSMNTVKKKWEISNYGNLPVTYVPPSNDIDRMGIKQLKLAMPSIKYMCSLYIGHLEDGGDREFDYDPFEKNFFDYPRISSGFYIEDDERYTINSMYLYTGIWTHFVHPDDIYQIPATADKRAAGYSLRNQYTLGWKKSKNSSKALFPEFKNFLKQLTTTYPQLRFVDGGVGGNIVMNWRASRFSHKSEKGLYTVSEINPTENKKYWFLYGSPANADRIETQLRNEMVLFSKTPFVDGYLYSVYSSKPKLTSIDLNYKSPKERAQLAQINSLVKADFAKFKIDVQNFIKGGVDSEIDYEKQLQAEMEALKNKLLTTAEINPTDWNKYAEYMEAEGKNAELWKMYEAHVGKHHSKNNVQYSKELDRMIGYMDDEAKEKWMSEQIAINPNDKALLTSYYNNFDAEPYKEKIKNVLKTLWQLDPSVANFKNYIKHLIQYYPEEALVVLTDVKPTKDYSDIATAVVWLFADNAEYNKAIEWSDYSAEIDFVTKMNWYIEAGRSKELEPLYLKYIAEHPEDEIATVLMSNVYHEQGRFKDSWVLANSLSNIYEKEELRKTLNRDVVYENMDLQQDLIANHAALFYPDVLAKLQKDIRLAIGDFIDFNSYLETNQKNPAFQRNFVSYNHYSKKGFLHSIGVNYAKYYELEVTKKKYEDNRDNNLIGLEYKLTTPTRENKPQYWSRARVELDKSSNTYYQFGAGLTRSKERNYRSASLNLQPVETAPGVNQKIYQVLANIYQDFYIGKYINASLSFEGNYYTEGFLSRDTIGPIIDPNRGISLSRKKYTEIGNGIFQVDDTDDSYDASLTLRMMLDKGDEKKSKFIPYIESQVSHGSRDLSIGYPYWIIKNRIYGGGGLGWKYTTPTFGARIEAGAFLDSFSGHFERLNTELSYQIFDFTALSFNLEVFEQSKFYSNSILFGIKHNFQKKYRKKK